VGGGTDPGDPRGVARRRGARRSRGAPDPGGGSLQRDRGASARRPHRPGRPSALPFSGR
jgi:hypothetical protein